MPSPMFQRLIGIVAFFIVVIWLNLHLSLICLDPQFVALSRSERHEFTAIPAPCLGISGPSSRDEVPLNGSPVVQVGIPWNLDSFRGAVCEVIGEHFLVDHESAL